MEDKQSSTTEDVISRKLIDLGLNFHEAQLYLLLIKGGTNSVWYLAKQLALPRTTVYRYIENLVNLGFVVERVEGKSKKYEALIIDKFENLVKIKEQELVEAKKNSESLIQALTSMALSSQSNYKVLHYKGTEGLKQVTWNCTHAKDTFRIFEIDSLSTMVDVKFAEEMRFEFSKMPIGFRQLTNNTVFTDFTKVTAHVAKWYPRHISKDVLDIKIETQVYNDVVCMLDYTQQDLFILEIYNQKLADMYKQMFDFYWNSATPMRKLSEFGAAKVV